MPASASAHVARVRQEPAPAGHGDGGVGLEVDEALTERGQLVAPEHDAGVGHGSHVNRCTPQPAAAARRALRSASGRRWRPTARTSARPPARR